LLSNLHVRVRRYQAGLDRFGDRSPSYFSWEKISVLMWLIISLLIRFSHLTSRSCPHLSILFFVHHNRNFPNFQYSSGTISEVAHKYFRYGMNDILICHFSCWLNWEMNSLWKNYHLLLENVFFKLHEFNNCPPCQLGWDFVFKFIIYLLSNFHTHLNHEYHIIWKFL